MGNKTIKKEAKKPKQSSKKTLESAVSATPRPTVTQPELIKKVKKPK